MIEPQWVLKSVDQSVIENIIREFDVPEVFARVMALRNITNRSQSQEFFYTDLNQMYDPFLMLDMDKAVDRVITQLENKKRILVFGDYDVDGTSGTSLLYLFLKSIGGDVQFYIPNRELEGYGVSNTGIDYAESIGADVFITCDCGITAIAETEYANSKGIDVIITDHHKQGDELPKAHSILNPNRRECTYPFKGLCGAGVAFKLATAICKKLDLDPELAWKYCDLVTVAITADIVPVIDENRIIVNHGMKLLREGNNPGLTALLKSSGLDQKELTVGRIVFKIAPKINAAGRLGDAGRAVKLMTTNNPVYAWEMAEKLEKENKRRQDITQSITEDAIYQVNAKCDLENENAIVLESNGWHQGVIGIVASRIKELFYRPCIIISFNDKGVGTGSARSISNFDMYDALSTCSDFLDGFGGHPMAAGLTIQKKSLQEFKSALINYANSTIQGNDLHPNLYFDSELSMEDIDGRFMKLLKSLAPYGPGNMRPKFISRNVEISGYPQLVGYDTSTLKFKIKSDRMLLDAIGFNMAEHYEKLILDKAVDLAFIVSENVWRGKISIQLEIKDIKESEKQYD